MQIGRVDGLDWLRETWMKGALVQVPSPNGFGREGQVPLLLWCGCSWWAPLVIRL